MIQIAITSENYQYESMAYKRLLEQKFKERNVRFIPLLKTIDTDYQNPKRVVRFLKAELKNSSFKAVVVCRDLDGLPSEESKIRQRNEWFFTIDKGVENHKCLFYLAIYESESLILGDIENFNKWCGKGITINFTSHPMYQSNPKPSSYLKEKSKEKYDKRKIAEVCAQLDVNNILKKHTGDYSFKELVDKIEKIIE